MKRSILIATLTLLAGMSVTVSAQRIRTDARSEARSGSSLTGNNLRLEKNTTFRLALNGPASVNDN